MKKLLSLLLSAAMGVSALTLSPAPAKTDAAQRMDVALFGDSIAAGYGLSSTEYNYGQICADYLGGAAMNYAVSGDTSEDMLRVIKNMTDVRKAAVADAEVIIISVGGNDIMHYASKYLLNYAAKNGFLNPGYTAADIPSDPGISDLLKYINVNGEGGLADYAASGPQAALELGSELKALSANIRLNTGDYVGIIPNQIIPNIKSSVAELKAINPNAKIVVQTIYQPLQFEEEYVNSHFGAGSSYKSLLGILRSNLRTIMDAFRTQLSGVSDISVADVYYDFTSMPDSESQNDQNPGHSSYFVNIQSSGEERDIHPNQKGHLAIASVILNTVGELHKDNGLLTKVYSEIADKEKYPTIALASYKKAAGQLSVGDVNIDGKVDARDASVMLVEYANTSSGGKSCLSPLQKQIANINGDKVVNGVDAQLTMKYYAYVSAGNTATIEEFIKG